MPALQTPELAITGSTWHAALWKGSLLVCAVGNRSLGFLRLVAVFSGGGACPRPFRATGATGSGSTRSSPVPITPHGQLASPDRRARGVALRPDIQALSVRVRQGRAQVRPSGANRRLNGKSTGRGW